MSEGHLLNSVFIMYHQNEEFIHYWKMDIKTWSSFTREYQLWRCISKQAKEKISLLAQLWPFAVYDQTSILLFNCSFIYCFGGNIKANSGKYFLNRTRGLGIHIYYFLKIVAVLKEMHPIAGFAGHHILYIPIFISIFLCISWYLLCAKFCATLLAAI
jgi:hypothetical protein